MVVASGDPAAVETLTFELTVPRPTRTPWTSSWRTVDLSPVAVAGVIAGGATPRHAEARASMYRLLALVLLDGDGIGDACEGCSEPPALDQRPGSRPLLVAKTETGLLDLAWEDAGAAAYEVHAGTIAALRAGAPDHSSIGACAIPLPLVSLVPPSEDADDLVGSRCAGVLSSLGRDSLRVERPPPIVGCP